MSRGSADSQGRLRALPDVVAEPAHSAVCAIDGEPWPCEHQRLQAHEYHRRRWDVFCLACGKRRNAWTSLRIENGPGGRMIYFHDRKRCRMAAKAWWEANVAPRLDGQRFLCGETIVDLERYIGARTKPRAVES